MKIVNIFKRVTTLGMAAVAAASLFSCAESDDDGLTKVEMWYIPSQSEAGEPPADWFVYDKIKTELGINLVLKGLPTDQTELTDIIMKAANTNTLPDLFRCSRSTMQELAKMDKIASVDSMFQMMPIRTKEIYTQAARESAQIDGRTFALAYPTATAATPKNEGILIRKDWLDNLGLQIPKTIDDYYRVMEAFTFNDPDRNGKQDTYGFGAYIEANVQEDGLGKRFSPIFGAFGVCGTLNYTKNNIHLNIREPAFYDALDFVRKMTMAKVIDPNWIAYKKDDFRNAWKSGRFGIMREQFSAYSSKSNYSQFDEKFPDAEWIVINPPVGPNGKSAVGINTLSWNYLAMNKRAMELGKTEKIARLLEWLYTDGYLSVRYGKEGINYIVDADGNISDKVPNEKDAYTSAESRNLLQLRWLVDKNTPDNLRERYPIWTTKNGRVMDPLAVLKQMQSKPWIDGYTFEKMGDELQKKYRTGIKDFATGKRTLSKDNWVMFIKELDDDGLAKWESKLIEQARDEGLMR